MDTFLKELGINDDYNKDSDGNLVIDLTENKFFKYESLLDKSVLLDIDENSSNVSYESITKQYESDNYLITLIGDLEGDTYRLTIKEIGED